MKNNIRLRRRKTRIPLMPLLIGGCLISIFVGCGHQRPAADVNVELARNSLHQVLTHWQDGGQIEQLRDQSPEIIVQEGLWSGGHILKSFVITPQSRAENANWFCDVELTLTPPDGGRPQTKTVTYAIGTDPVITVFHAML